MTSGNYDFMDGPNDCPSKSAHDSVVFDVEPDNKEHIVAEGFDLLNWVEENGFKRMLEDIHTIKFNIFDLRSASNGNELFIVINYLMTINNLFEKLGISSQTFRRYSLNIQSRYNPIAYHNKTHAADVAQTSYYFVKSCGYGIRGQMTDLDKVALFVGSFVHDTDHPGFNNVYMVSTSDKLALRYNDKSVLENHHIAVAFEVMLSAPNQNIYENLNKADYKTMRDYMINLVLATDMARHFDDIKELQTRL